MDVGVGVPRRGRSDGRCWNEVVYAVVEGFIGGLTDDDAIRNRRGICERKREKWRNALPACERHILGSAMRRKISAGDRVNFRPTSSAFNHFHPLIAFFAVSADGG